MFRKAVAAATVGAFLALGGAAQATTTFSFENIAGGDTYGDAYAGNFTLDVTDLGGGEVLFQIVSASVSGVNYFIRTIFLDDTDPSSFTATPSANDVTHSSGLVAMSYDPGGNLPQGNNVGFSAVFNFDRDTGQGCGANACAVQQGETAGFVFGGDFAGIIASLTSGELSVGIHLQGIDGGYSDSFVTSVPVPLPAAGLMLLGAIGGLGLVRRRKAKQG